MRASPIRSRGARILLFLPLLLRHASSWTCLPNGDIAIGAAIYPTSLLPPLSVTFPGSPPNYNLTLCAPFSPLDISPACAGAPAFGFQLTKGDGAGCYALGRERTQALPAPAHVELRMEAGDAANCPAPRTLVVDLVCSDAPVTEPLRMFERPRGGCDYHATVVSPAGCVRGCPRDPATGLVCGGPAHGTCVAS